MKEELEDRVDAYLLGEMTDEERHQFEMDAENDMELKTELEFSENVQKALRSRSEKLIAIREWEKNRREKSAKEETVGAKKKAIRQSIYWLSGIAAVFIVGLFLFNDFVFHNDIDLAYSPNNQGAIKGVDKIIENLLAQGDFKNALAQIEEMEDNISSERLVLECEKQSKGVDQNDIFQKQEMLDFRLEELSWLKVQALIGLNRLEEALSLLDEIRHSDSDFKNQADSLYNALKK